MQENYEVVDFEEKADIYIVNTCTVTNMSDRKSRQILRHAKQINNKAILVVIGCYVQVAKEELEKIKEIDLILGNNEKKDIINHINQYIEENQKCKVTDVMHQKEYLEFENTTYIDKTRAVVKIQDGCDRFCTYCIIPYARGRVRSRKIENIVKEINDIAKQGIQEIVITGIHIGSYGKDLKEKISLIDVLKEINKIDGIKRIRLGSLEPKTITEEFLEELIKLEKICHHFHLSLQSGCDETLERMNRKYNTNEFKEAVELIRKKYPDVLLTADVIVGFPGETEEEFETTYRFLEEIKFYKIHVFKYSKRKGTKAAIMPNQISPEKQNERSSILIELSNKVQEKYNKEYIGEKVQVLIEEKEGKYYKGHTSNYMMIYVETKENLENKIIDVKITKTQQNKIIAEI